MSWQTTGLNLEGIKNIEPINITINENILGELPSTANAVTGGYFGLIVSLTMFFVLFWFFADKSQFGFFRYTKIRALGISSAFVGILGYVALTVGIFFSFYHTVVFFIITAIATLWVYMEERQE